LRSKGYSVTVKTEPFGFTIAGAPEVIGIFIGSGVATALVHDVSTDIYNAAKKWAGKRKSESTTQDHSKQQAANTLPLREGPLRISIYGPDKKPLATLEVPGELLGEYIVISSGEQGERIVTGFYDDARRPVEEKYLDPRDRPARYRRGLFRRSFHKPSDPGDQSLS
jgi:hypothetical protein